MTRTANTERMHEEVKQGNLNRPETQSPHQLAPTNLTTPTGTPGQEGKRQKSDAILEEDGKEENTWREENSSDTNSGQPNSIVKPTEDKKVVTQSTPSTDDKKGYRKAKQDKTSTGQAPALALMKRCTEELKESWRTDTREGLGVELNIHKAQSF